MNYILIFTLTILITVLFSLPAFGQTGKTLYEQKCTRCHAAFDPSDYSAAEWPALVRSMKAQAALSSQDITDITEYLVDASEGSESHAGEPIVGGYLYTEYFQSPQKVKNFDLHYLAVSIAGWSTDKLNYLAEFELEHGGTGGHNTFVEQAYLDYWFVPNVAVKVGAMLTPFNRFDEMHDPILNFTITRPQVSREIGVSAWKDVGVDLHGYFSLNEESSLSFDLYAINGLGDGSSLRGSRQYRDNNEKRSYGGRVNVMFRDILEVGGSVYRGAWDDAGDLNLLMLGSHVMFRTPFADIYGEYAKATSENITPFEDGDMSGFFVQASRLIEYKYRPTIRYGNLDYLDIGESGVRGSDKHLSELALAFSYYPKSKVVFKFEYTLFMEGSRKAKVDNDQIGLQVAVKF